MLETVKESANASLIFIQEYAEHDQGSGGGREFVLGAPHQNCT